MTTEMVYNQWYDNLIEELKDFLTEKEYISRWELIDCYHQVGVRIIQENDNFERAKIYGEKIVQRVANSLGKKPSTIYAAIKFAKLYPDLDLLPEGKNISWHHIVNKYLTGGLTTGEKRVIVTRGELMKQVEAIKKLLETRYSEYHQREINLHQASYDYDHVKAIIGEIRYLQDQVEKIMEGIE